MIEEIKNNWKSALSVALISVPLSLSLGIAAGASPTAGIITAIWAGLIAGIFGGSHFNIVGPAGALAGILAAYSATYSPAILPFISIGAGLISLCAWVLGWDRYLIFVPSSVVHGFTLGVAFTIGFGQLNAALGLTGLPMHESVLENAHESLKHIAASDPAAYLPFFAGLAIMFIILKLRPLWPNSIIVAGLGVLVGYLSKVAVIPLALVTLGDKFPALSLSLFSLPDSSVLLSSAPFADLSSFGKAALLFELSSVVAFVLVLETLISAKIADGATKTKFNQSREVFGVGLANLVSGFFGGIPASGVFARTALNIKSGARSRVSQVLNGLFVAVITFVVLPVFQYIPLSIIASILIYVSIRMVTAEHLKKLFVHDKVAFTTSIAVGILTVAYDATMGILVGTAVALLFLVNKISVAQSNITVGPDGESSEKGGDTVVYHFAGELTYVNSKSHIERLAELEVRHALVLNFKNLFYIDLDGAEALEEIVDALEHKGHHLYVSSVRESVRPFLLGETWYRKLESNGRVLSSTKEALSLAQRGA